MRLTNEELQEKLAAHKRWIASRNNEKVEGERLDLTGADLTRADLTGADLTHADLTRANLDYSAWPLWCRSLGAKIDRRLAAQLLYHALRAMQSCAGDADVAAVLASEANIHLANQFHRVNECGPLHAAPAPRRTDTTEDR